MRSMTRGLNIGSCVSMRFFADYSLVSRRWLNNSFAFYEGEAYNRPAFIPAKLSAVVCRYKGGRLPMRISIDPIPPPPGTIGGDVRVICKNAHSFQTRRGDNSHAVATDSTLLRRTALL